MTSINTSTSVFDDLGLAKATEAAKPQRLGQEQFLELMVAQLRNQDPLKPMESGEFLSQMAQFSTVTGIQDLQESFKTVADSLYSNQALQASALVGRTVLVSSEQASLGAGGAVSGVVELSASTPKLDVAVYDQAGSLVRRVSLGQQASGLIPFSWDGRTDSGAIAAPGTYRLKAEAILDGHNVAQETLVTSRVDSVTLGRGAEGITVNLNGLGPVGFDQVRQIQ
jgi:flagellar basal-body rod modification protein FlgD